MEYRAPLWLPGSHAQTIVPRWLPVRSPRYRRQRWETPDGDFIDLDWATPDAPSPTAPLLVLFHGLEGSSSSHYARTIMSAIVRRNWLGVVPHFRGCSGEINRLPRAYHSGDSDEIDWILRRIAAQHPQRPLFAAGVSLGGNALLKWLGERGTQATGVIRAAAAICPPLDLAACGHRLAQGFNRVYTRYFLRTLKAAAGERLRRHPGIFDERAMRDARTLWEFDEAVTAPLHGFAGADDYWRRASSKSLLRAIAVPTLLVSPRNDPFLPVGALPERDALSPAIRFETPATGGHVGFIGGWPPGHLDWLPKRLLSFFSEECPAP